jgi:hypothetical protein
MKLTPEKLTAFLAALAETCNVGRACKAVDISRVTAYEWRDKDPAFAEAWDKAKAIGVTALEDEAARRAHDGVATPVFHNGFECGTVQKYSDTLMIFLLKAHDPKYRDQQRIDLGNADDKPFEVSGDVDRAARLGSLLAVAQARREAEEDDGEDLA